MTEDEARKIARIVESADGYCSYCAAGLAVQLVDIWPEYPWLEWVGGSPDDEEDT